MPFLVVGPINIPFFPYSVVVLFQSRHQPSVILSCLTGVFLRHRSIDIAHLRAPPVCMAFVRALFASKNVNGMGVPVLQDLRFEVEVNI